MSTIPTQRIYEGYLCLRVFFVRRVGYFQYCGMEGGTPCRYRQIICNIPPLWDFLISPDFHRGGRFRRQILSFFVPVLSYVDVNTLFRGGYFYVGLRGAGWYFLPENPTFFVRRNRKIPHREKSQQKQNTPTMATSATASSAAHGSLPPVPVQRRGSL